MTSKRIGKYEVTPGAMAGGDGKQPELFQGIAPNAACGKRFME